MWDAAITLMRFPLITWACNFEFYRQVYILLLATNWLQKFPQRKIM